MPHDYRTNDSNSSGSKFSGFAALVARFALPVVGLWVFAAVALNLIAPPIEQMIIEHGSPLFPVHTASGEALKRMGRAFGESSSNNQSVFILEKNAPFGEADQQYRVELVRRLKADKAHVESVFDTWSDPQLAAATESPDKQLAFLQLNLAGNIGSPKAVESVQAVQSIVDSIPKPAGVSVYNAGMSQGAVEEIDAVMQDSIRLAIASAVLIGALLLFVYRSIWVAVLPLFTVGLAVAVADPLVNLLVQAGLLPTSLFTNALMGALMMGACTDYSIFFIGRYQEGRRAGQSIDEAYRSAYQGVAPVVFASGLTVAGGLACMDFAQLDLLKTMGTPCAIGLICSAASALTITPVVLFVGAKRFGLFEPKRRVRSATVWRRVGVCIARWPKPIFIASSVVLALCMLAIPTAELNFDELAYIPHNMQSAKGLSAVQRHFPEHQLYPDIVLIEADHDLRNSADIGTIEQTAQQLAKLPDVNAVQWLTRPLGAPLDQASLTFGAGYAGKMLSQNLLVIKERARQMRQLTDNLGATIELIDQLKAELSGAQQQAGALNAQSERTSATLKKLDKQIHDLRALAEPVRASLAEQTDCAKNLACSGANATLNGLADLGQLSSGLRQITALSASLQNGMTTSTSSIPLIEGSLVQLRDMANSINMAIEPMVSQLDMGVSLMQDLGRSSAGTGTYFYFPAQLLSDPRLKPYVGLMFSPDGKTTRLIVMGKSSSFGAQGMLRPARLGEATDAALKGTPLEGSVVTVSGSAATIADTHAILDRDKKIILVAALTLIFSIVLLLLRSVVAAGVVIASVVVSYLSTYGLSLFVWQHLIGLQLHWAVPLAVFAVLISVGADYNLLVASRFKEEMGAGVKTGVIRSITGTGGVVTTAGMVFAVTMFSMLGASLVHLAQMGFTIGMGLVIDTFVVRTFTVPTLAVMLGEKFWWPMRLKDL
ncbi:RND family transporter [Segniliparus rugosus]|uniref:Membrane transport protein MMPL domain-containing protein n=1 Tax=Segniliparus rugosus (strain ATCC BAA-974 / DSM 45345 / CCUG 50838 / CIP 108380 / JCM 13579 / CDC 945) TaxID=679197 RepID=E5XKL3_SEGRC|nr:RND family transporter [Segniliparus rugosus]EFV15125.1 hypothetical protein HMPREF9336_00032 [Segniliparus rugosus ATCC BAA-974]